MNNLGKFLLEQVRFEEAEEILGRLMERASSKSKADKVHPAVLALFQQNYGSLLMLTGRPMEAETALLESYGTLRLHRGDAYLHTKRALKKIVDLYESLDQSERAAEYRSRLPPSSQEGPR
ncbi:MAG: hypothetical protein O7H41_20390 [Planctomycetota bacterium]|nr:hypothetical protein [Planctomycetota bacterium]